MKIKEAFKLAMRTRSFWLMGAVSLVLIVATLAVTLTNLRVTSTNIPVHCTMYSEVFAGYRDDCPTNLSDKWYYPVSFILFVFAVFVTNLFLTAKMIAIGKRPLGMVIQFITILILFTTLMILMNIYGIIRLRLAI